MLFNTATLLALVLFLIIQFEFKTISIDQYYHQCENCEANFALNVVIERLMYTIRARYKPVISWFYVF